MHNTWTQHDIFPQIGCSKWPWHMEQGPFKPTSLASQVKAAQAKRDELETEGKWTRISFARVSAPWRIRVLTPWFSQDFVHQFRKFLVGSPNQNDHQEWWKPDLSFGMGDGVEMGCLKHSDEWVDVMWKISEYLFNYYTSGQIIATSHDLTPNGDLVREIPLFQVFPGWWNIIIWPDTYFIHVLMFFCVNNKHSWMPCLLYCDFSSCKIRTSLSSSLW